LHQFGFCFINAGDVVECSVGILLNVDRGFAFADPAEITRGAAPAAHENAPDSRE
jgi:hypothetical protein